MAANGSSLRRSYAAVGQAPPELWRLYEAMRGGNPRTLLGLLLERPEAIVFGEYRPEARVVAPAAALEWQSRIGWGVPSSSAIRDRIPALELELAVIGLRSLIRQYRRLPFNVWCERVSRVAAGSTREHLVVEIGLVDMRRPLAAASEAAFLPGR